MWHILTPFLHAPFTSKPSKKTSNHKSLCITVQETPTYTKPQNHARPEGNTNLYINTNVFGHIASQSGRPTLTASPVCEALQFMFEPYPEV
jgi:hypothetical protein